MKALPLLILLAGCATAEPEMLWKRTDGRPIPADPALVKQADLDRTICRGEAAKAPTGPHRRDQVFEGCMAQRGYVLAAQ